MSYSFQADRLYRMPTHFGPSLGPRQGLEGRTYSNINGPNATSIQATFKAKQEQLQKLLPPGFSLRDPCVISLDFSFVTNIEWLAGRGYNIFGISVPVTFTGQQETVHGELLLVIWENMADPIITGREDLGFSKIYCEIPEPQFIGNDVICRASWDGFEFARLKLSNLQVVKSEDLAGEAEEPIPSAGLLHYKYFPKTGCPGESDTESVTLTPAEWPNVKLESARQAATATLVFQEATWEQLPTLVHIVNTFSELTLGECIQATLTKTCGSKDLSDQRIVR